MLTDALIAQHDRNHHGNMFHKDCPSCQEENPISVKLVAAEVELEHLRRSGLGFARSASILAGKLAESEVERDRLLEALKNIANTSINLSSGNAYGKFLDVVLYAKAVLKEKPVSGD